MIHNNIELGINRIKKKNKKPWTFFFIYLKIGVKIAILRKYYKRKTFLSWKIIIASLEHPVEWAHDFISINYYRLVHLYFIHVKICFFFSGDHLRDSDSFVFETVVGLVELCEN